MTNAQSTLGTEDLAWFKSSYSGDQGGACLEVAFDWRKSSYSGEEGGNCLEVAYDWHKSSYSSDKGNACLEMATCPDAQVHIRDSKDLTGPTLALSSAAWASFTAFAASRRP
ncbi:DUF397 domain-containing protein [Streptomyces sp. NBC_01795]|uniref:DUF397 domain-containing protein n=1 Tax=Streptomyces sp. NBC_01795 TaxID=2975943 RepID=UPI002DDADE87|nr:DUF397 domain-containing protein [Streptomyces sp. NBC_01795]WSA93376.1 DUF397 domain-containing protein [Streptomyces sp. NBC_01795]